MTDKEVEYLLEMQSGLSVAIAALIEYLAPLHPEMVEHMKHNLRTHAAETGLAGATRSLLHVVKMLEALETRGAASRPRLRLVERDDDPLDQ